MAYTTIDKPTDYFNTKLWTGDDSSGHAITGVGFQPDWVWIKNRDTTDDHCIVDSIRGNTKVIVSNSNAAEITSTQRVQSFDSDGITVGADNDTNKSGSSIVGWNWLAGGSASSNSNGSITSSVSANTTAGFSIVSYTGTATSGVTIGHGLGVKPDMIILKNRGPDTASWQIYHSSLGATKYISLNLTDASDTSATRWNNTEPTTSVFTLGSSGDVVGDSSGETFIAYCFAEKKGYSKFGSYTGNGSTDGTFVYTGFKPAFLIIKNTGAAKNWYLFDNKRDTYNAQDSVLYPNLSNAETSVSDYNSLDVLSNGFKLRGGSTGVGDDTNGSYTYIYMAFAEAPFVTSTGIPTTAR